MRGEDSGTARSGPGHWPVTGVRFPSPQNTFHCPCRAQRGRFSRRGPGAAGQLWCAGSGPGVCAPAAHRLGPTSCLSSTGVKSLPPPTHLLQGPIIKPAPFPNFIQTHCGTRCREPALPQPRPFIPRQGSRGRRFILNPQIGDAFLQRPQWLGVAWSAFSGSESPAAPSAAWWWK